MTPTFYRYTGQNLYDGGVRINPERFYGIKETPCGWWISSRRVADGYEGDAIEYVKKFYARVRWVSNTSRKRFAYPTREEALDSFIWRKRRQQDHARASLAHAKECERQAEGMLADMKAVTP